ncbi:sensor histidine kinase [Haloimpatiens sp. FM7315]|uniref:sensor histidine kinase n=1 Tax=Haloimpatiens sp. FM7315 TaxID=3298609 RepID=UPI0035A2ADD9
MNFFKYLKDNIRLLVFYLFLMSFITMTIWLDRRNRLLDSNIIYILIVSLIMFVLYLLWDYHIKYSYINELIKFKNCKDKTPMLPKFIEYKDEVYEGILKDLYEYYNVSIKNKEDKVAEDGEFITSWVHEIKTPITALKLLLSYYEEELNNKANIDDKNTIINNSYSYLNDVRNSILNIKEESDKIDDYVEKVLYYSRSDSFSKDYIISEVYLNSIVKESVKKHSTIFIRKHIKFINEIQKDVYVYSDKKWLLFIIDQLISNALKYSKEPKDNESLNSEAFIKVSNFENEKEKVLVIEDNGKGIKKEDLERLFNKSFTGNNGRNFNSKSTGMGLYLSRKLANKLNHYITIKSSYGRNTTLYVHFPKWEKGTVNN